MKNIIVSTGYKSRSLSVDSFLRLREWNHSDRMISFILSHFKKDSTVTTGSPLSTKYSSFAARLLMKPLFENQWVIPECPPRLVEQFLKWYEERRLDIDLSDIQIDRPIFIISLPRCGSSMLQDIICEHSQVAYITNMMDTFRSSLCAAEHFRQKLGFNVRGERFLKDSVEVDGGSPADPVATWADWFHQDPFRVEYQDLTIESFPPEDVARVKDAIRKVLWCFGGKATRFECKTPALLPHAVLLKDMFPDAKFIHLVRDARASANSLLKLFRLCNDQLIAIRRRKKQPIPDTPFIPYPRMARLQEHIEAYGPDDIRTTAHLWNDGVDFVRKNQHLFPNFHEVRYEDILADPQMEIGRILDFCELPHPPQQNQGFWGKVSKVGVVHHKNAYANFDVVEEICQKNMQEFGYL